jgi:AcrR family transcriptional regulator
MTTTNAKRAPRANSREKILDAAEKLVAELGVATLTFEALAKRSGVSRGGILYNFNTKDELVAAMVQRLVERFETAERAHKDDGTPPLEAYIRAGLNSAAGDVTLSSALLTAAMNDPSLLKRVQGFYGDGIKHVLQGPAGLDGTVLALASDALVLLDVLRLTPFDAGDRQRIVEHILSRARSMSGL